MKPDFEFVIPNGLRFLFSGCRDARECFSDGNLKTLTEAIREEIKRERLRRVAGVLTPLTTVTIRLNFEEKEGQPWPKTKKL